MFLVLLLVVTSYSFLPFLIEPSVTNHRVRDFLIQKVQLKNGDLIFRRGTSIESQIVLLSDRESEYSHVGIIYILNGKPYVIHSVPSEADEKNEYIKMEKLESFLSDDKAARFALYRLRDELKDESQAAGGFAYNCYLRKYSFDNDYDLKTDSKLYCTELIWKAYKSAGIDLLNGRLRSVNFIVVNKKLIMPSSIIQSKLLRNIYSN